MAGFAEQDTAHTHQITALNTPRESSSRPSLPSGPCNYRDATSGHCGCDQFWDKCSAELHDQSTEHRPTSARSTWCVCGHHACFHLKASRTPTTTPQFQAYEAKYSEGHQALSGAQREKHHIAVTTAIVDAQETHTKAQATQAGRYKSSHSGIVQRLSQPDVAQRNEPRRIEQGRDAPSQASISDLPSIPSVCMLSRDQRSETDLAARHDANQSHRTVTGLGLSMMRIEGNGSLARQQSPSPTVADENSISRVPQQSFSEPEIASTRANSIAAEADRVSSPPRGLLDQIVEFNRNLQLDTGGDTIPNTYNPNDYIQSATEIATPSVANTPDLGIADQAVQEGKDLIDTLRGLTSNMQQPNGSPSRQQGATSASGSQQWLTNSPAVPQEQLQQVLRAASPKALQKLVSYLAPLHNLLNSIPNVANTMRDLSSRIDVLESGSFNYVQPEELNQTLGFYDDRIIDLEHRMTDHEKHHQALEAEDSTTSSRRHLNHVTNSFDSNQSLQSTTSSALILAAVDRKDTEMELGNIKDRLDILESVALPTTYQPWEVEVVLIPWGRDLRGIWFSHDEPMHDTSRTTTQDTEEWTQARTSRHGRANTSLRDMDSSPYRGTTMIHETAMSDNESGWSSQAISNWATGSADDWLFPKACGSNNLVFKRLQSRGFVRNVTLTNASARDLQAALSHAFSDLLEHLSYTNQDDDVVIAAHPGLRASFIPLRKVHKESKLRFLGPAEMSSSALWSAHFLGSGIMMRVSGGRKRLYVTQREAYMQHSDDLGSTWTWQELRQLPRVQPDQDSQMEGNDEHCQPAVPEADAKEACWQYIEAYDAPPASVHSSFGSHQSVELSVRPAHNDWRRSITPSSILKNKMPQPLSPQSEFHPRPAQIRQRTTSASIVEPLISGSSKRRFNSSPVKQSSAPQPTLRTPSVSVGRLKRRRTANPSSLHQEQSDLADAQLTTWNPTPRRSHEPPSPFFSSQPRLPRTNSDVASRPSQRSVAIVGKSTPFAYATPHSGPFQGVTIYNNGGDTEPDDDEDDQDEDGEDGEQSWRGVTDGEDEIPSSTSSSSHNTEDGIQEASFSGDDSGFGSDSGDGQDDDDDEQSEFDIDRNHPRHNTTTDDDEEEGDVFDTLLDVLQH